MIDDYEVSLCHTWSGSGHLDGLGVILNRTDGIRATRFTGPLSVVVLSESQRGFFEMVENTGEHAVFC